MSTRVVRLIEARDEVDAYRRRLAQAQADINAFESGELLNMSDDELEERHAHPYPYLTSEQKRDIGRALPPDFGARR